MTKVNQSIMNSMLKNISDPKLRETYGDIVSGKYAYEIYCLKPQINPLTKKPFHGNRVAIGYLTKRGKVIDACVTDKKTGQPIAGVETSRDRFDGRKGFRCYCGNWSIQAKEEQGVLKAAKVPRPPTRDELQEIFQKVEKSGKGPLQFSNGWAEYDGFGLKEIEL